MHMTLHHRNALDRLYMRKMNCQNKDSVETWIQRLEDSREKRRERLITITRNNTDNRRSIERKLPEDKNRNEYEFMDVLSD